MAVATSAMLRTCAVRFDRHEVDVVGQVLPGAGDARHFGLPAELAFGADLARHARHLGGEGVQLIHHRVDGVLQLQNLALHVHGDLAREVAARDGRGHLGDVADLSRQVARHRVDAVGQVLPGAGDARHVRLAAEPSLGADLARDARHLAGEGVQLIDHRVDGFLQLQNLAAHVDRDFSRQVAAGHRRRHLGDVAHLVGQVAGHRVDAVGQVLPGAGDARHRGLTAELAVGADLARHARHLGGEGVQLIHHRVDGFLQLQNLAADVHGDLLGEVALGDRGRDLGDVAHLTGQVARHRIDAVRQVFPGAAHAAHDGLTAELAFRSDLARDARHLAGEGVQLIHHRVDGVLQFQNLAAHVDGDLLRKVAARDGGRDVGDVSDLRGQIARHRVHAVGQVLPGSRHAAHVRLPAKAPIGADLARHARHLAGEGVQLVDHRVDGFLQLQNLAADIDGDLLGKVAAGDGRRDVGDVADLGGQVRRHEVDVVGQILPGAGDAGHFRLAAELSFGADFARHARHFRGEGVQLVDHRVDGVLQLQNLAAHVDGDFSRQVAARDRGRDLRDVADLVGQVAAHGVDGVGQILPGAGDARHDRLPAELSIRADLACDARHFGGERAKLIDHRVDGFLQLQNLAAHVDGDLLRKVAAGDRDRHVGDVADLRRQVARHRVDALGQVLPDAGDFRHLRLTAELSFGADLARDARHLRREDAELLQHRVDDGGRLQELALQRPPFDVEADGLQEIALRDRVHRAGQLGGRPEKVVDQRVDGGFHLAPRAARKLEGHALAGLAFPAHHAPDMLELLRHPLIGGDDVVEGVGDLAGDAGLVAGHADGEVADPHRLKGAEKAFQLRVRGRFGERVQSLRTVKERDCFSSWPCPPPGPSVPLPSPILRLDWRF